MPDPTGLGLFYYLAFFVLGYLVVWTASSSKHAERYRLPALAPGIALAVWWVAHRQLARLAARSLVAARRIELPGHARVVAGRRRDCSATGSVYLDRTSPTLAYLAEASYPVYILHQTVIVVAAFSIVGLAAAEPLQWLTLLVVSVAVTFALYEVVRRFSVSRFLFGMRPLTKKDAGARAPLPAVEPAAGRSAAGKA